MGNNKPIDKLIVQKVFEMIRADKSFLARKALLFLARKPT